MSSEERSNVLILSTFPLVVAGVRQALPECSLREIEEEDLSDPAPAAGAPVLILNPLFWEELARWLSPLRRHFAACPWIIIADPRIPGAFVSDLPARCGLLSQNAPLSKLQRMFRAVVEDRVTPPGEALKQRYAAGIHDLVEAQGAHSLTTKELECACARSLHISYAQIAQNLHLSEGSVKADLRHGRLRFPKDLRGKLTWFVDQALIYQHLPERE